jgi:hypothetical protein
MSRRNDQFDLKQAAADDALLTALASGGMINGASPENGCSLEQLLLSWHDELDAVVPPATQETSVISLSAMRDRQPGSGGMCRTRRRTVAIAGMGLATVLAMTGTAAAFTGAHGPLGTLHRALFGGAAQQHHPDQLALHVSFLLSQAQSSIAAAHDAGGISTLQRGRIASILSDAERLLAADRDAPEALINRAATLRSALNGLPTLPPRQAPLAPSAETPTPKSSPSRAGTTAATARPAGSAISTDGIGDQTDSAHADTGPGSGPTQQPSGPDGASNSDTPGSSSGGSQGSSGSDGGGSQPATNPSSNGGPSRSVEGDSGSTQPSDTSAGN